MTEKLQAHVTHRFKASPERVFDAWLDPDKVRRWLFATSESGLKQAAIDAREGGQYILVDARAGGDSVMSGAYVTIARPAQLTLTLFAPDYSKSTLGIAVSIRSDGTGAVLDLVAEIGRDQVVGKADIETGWTAMFNHLDTIA